MATAQIPLQQRELFVGCPWAAFGHHQIVIGLDVAALRRRGAEFRRHYPHRNAGLAVKAARTIGNGLAAAETDPSQRLVKLFGMLPLELGEDLALAPPRQVRAWRRTCHAETGKTNRGRQDRKSTRLNSSH